ncbi:MAG: methyltransferase [Candidatus Cloacimonadaceae bacterium]|nr:methyltransferase [Candidatus Cloacimonadaceae bacterium]
MKRVDLPFPGKYIYQDTNAQAVSGIAAALQNAVINAHDDAPRNVIELGSGCGIISIMLALQRPSWSITGIEIQAHLHNLALQNATLCEVPVSFLLEDIRTCKASPKADIILSNPPWQSAGSGILSPHESKNISRVELLCTMMELMQSLKRNLHQNGDAWLIYPHSREKDLQTAADKTFLDIKDILTAPDLKAHIICHLRHKGIEP